MLQVMEVTEAASRKGSVLVAAFCSKNDVDIETFHLLTDATLLPNIDMNAVWPLLEREREFFGSTQSTVSSLQARCIDALVEDFDAVEHDDDDPLCMQSAAFLYKLIIKVKEHKQNDDTSSENEDEDEQNVEPLLEGV